MIAGNTFSWNDHHVLKHTLYAGSLYFIIVTLFSVFNYKGMFLLDGTSVIFEIANTQSFPETNRQNILYLGQLLPVSLAMAGASLKWIIIGYILNIYLFYFILFYILVRVLKDALGAILLILVHYKGVSYNHFFTAEELLPGACLAILLLSFVLHFNRVKVYMGYLAITVLSLLMVNSHPLVLVCFAGGIVVIALLNKNIHGNNLIPISISLATVLLFLLIKVFYFHSHDVLQLRSQKSFVQSLLQLLDPTYFSEFMLYLFLSRATFSLIFIIIVVYFLVLRKYRYLAIFSVVSVVVAILFNMHVTHESFRVYQLGHELYDWWSLPLRFVVFAFFCYLVLCDIRTQYIFRMARMGFAFQLIVGSISFLEQHTESRAHMTQTISIIEKSWEEGHSKVYVLNDELPVKRSPNRPFLGSLILSSLTDPDDAVHIVYVDDVQDVSILEELEEDELIFHIEAPPLDDDFLDDNYFDIEDSDYHYVSIND